MHWQVASITEQNGVAVVALAIQTNRAKGIVIAGPFWQRTRLFIQYCIIEKAYEEIGCNSPPRFEEMTAFRSGQQ